MEIYVLAYCYTCGVLVATVLAFGSGLLAVRWALEAYGALRRHWAQYTFSRAQLLLAHDILMAERDGKPYRRFIKPGVVQYVLVTGDILHMDTGTVSTPKRFGLNGGPMVELPDRGCGSVAHEICPPR